MCKKPCKECPWVVRNKNNDSIVNHSKRLGKKHNCHMVPVSKRKTLWDQEPSHQCVGNKLHFHPK